MKRGGRSFGGNLFSGINSSAWDVKKDLTIREGIVSATPSSIIRSGVIPYINTERGRLYCLGIDQVWGDMTDFGGGVKRYENPIEAGIREFKEESLCIFDLKNNWKTDTTAIFNDVLMVMLVEVANDKDYEALYEYNKRYADKIIKLRKEGLTLEGLMGEDGLRSTSLGDNVSPELIDLLPSIDRVEAKGIVWLTLHDMKELVDQVFGGIIQGTTNRIYGEIHPIIRYMSQDDKFF